MTITEINEQLQKHMATLLSTQKELEDTLADLPLVKNAREAKYNSKMIAIIGEARINKEKEPAAIVKEAMCEIATEQESLQLRVLEYSREGLKSRLDVLQVAISVLQTTAKLTTEELQLSRYGRSNQT